MVKVLKKYIFLVISIFNFLIFITFIFFFSKYLIYFNSVELIGTKNLSINMEKNLNGFLDEEEIIEKLKAFVLKKLNINDFSNFPKNWQNNLNSKDNYNVMSILYRILQKETLQKNFKNEVFLITKKNIKNNIKNYLFIFITFSVIFLLISIWFLIIFLLKKKVIVKNKVINNHC